MDTQQLTDTRRQCTATSKQSGVRCKRRPIRGGFVCKIHGGGSPQVKQKAEERLREMIDPALAKLLKLVQQDKVPAVALGAVRDVLDRNQVGTEKPAAPQVNVNVFTKVERVIVRPNGDD
jgi:hypothetical protein